MIFAATRVMLLSLLRDRAALALTFALPPAIFVIFAAIFASATGDELRLHVGLADTARTATTRRLADALRAEPGLRVTSLGEGGTAEGVRELVRRGAVDVGVVLRADLETRPGEGPTPVLVVEDAARALAAPIVIGQVQKTLNERLPDVALARILADVESAGGISREERAFLDQAFRAQAAGRAGGGFSFAAVVAREAATKVGTAGGPVAYYAGAVAAVFLLFAAMQGGATLVDERESGIAERLFAGPGGAWVVVLGKFGFLTAQGAVQAALIFAAAWLLYGVDVTGAFGRWLATCLLAAAMAAALGLAVAAACRTRHQAQIVATFGVLLVSAVGGSMVPRFLMPPWLQDLGRLTPNAWAIDAFQTALRPGAPLADLALPWAVLAAASAAGLAAAIVLSGRSDPASG